MPKLTTQKMRDLKGKEKITCLTAADCTTASMLDAAGVQIILVGDSLAMTALGYDSTLPVTVAEMLHHTAAVARGVTHGLVVADMPFMSYQVSIEQAIENAGRFIKESHADAVKIEGGLLRADTVRALVRNGIPVLGHIGLTPQSIKEMGGYRVQGRASKEADALIEDAHALEAAGAFAIVLECIPAALGKIITESVVGIHTVRFENAGERIELTHNAHSRDAFALGALKAAEWVARQRPRLYDMQDMLGLNF